MPTALKIALWFGQVGVLIHTFWLLVWRLTNSAAMRSAPVPPKLCAVLARLFFTISEFAPNNNSLVRALKSATPSIGK